MLSIGGTHINIVIYLFISICLFVIGVLGIFSTRKNIIIILMSIELMLLAINFSFIIFSVFLDDIIGQIFALIILTIAAAESAIGLAILVIYYRLRGIISVDYISTIKG
jgi:NADH-quinone oxidoreductase subunit K